MSLFVIMKRQRAVSGKTDSVNSLYGRRKTEGHAVTLTQLVRTLWRDQVGVDVMANLEFFFT